VRWLVALVVVAALGSARAEHFAVRTFTTADGLANGRVYHATRDANGFLWFATADGLSRFDGVRFESFGVADGLPDPGCRDVHAAHDGRIWVATERGLAWLDLTSRSRRPRFTAIHLEGNADFIGRMFEDSHHQLWFGTEDGLWKLDDRGVPVRVSLRDGRQPAVYAFAEDRGTLWLGTSWGLVRRMADGRAERYRVLPAETTDDRTVSLRLDRAGRLWIGGVGAGPFAVMPTPPGTPLIAAGASLTGVALPGHTADGRVALPRLPGEVVHYDSIDGYPYDAVRRGIYEDATGTVWLAGGHLVAFDGARFEIRGRAQGFPEDSVAPLVEDPAGNVWFGGLSAGVVRFSPHGLITYDALDGLDADRIMSVVEDAAGTIYGVSLGPVAQTLERFERDHFVAIVPRASLGTVGAWGANQIGFFDRDDRWWQPTQTGLDRYPHVAPDALATMTPEHFSIADGLPGRDIFHLFEDRAGDVWIGTLSDVGLARWSRATNQIAAVKLPGLPQDMVAAFAEDATGAIWIGYGDGALARIHDGRARVFGPADGWQAHHVETLLVDHQGRLWVGTDAGIARIDDPGAPRVAPVRYRAATGLSTDQITAFVEDAAGRIYAGTTRGVDRIDPTTGTIDHLTIADGLPNDYINAAHRDRSGQLWFATNRGLARFVPYAEGPAVVAPAMLTSVRAGRNQLELAAGGDRAVPALELEHDESNLDVAFTSPSFAIGVPVQFQFRLEGGDEEAWIGPTTAREVHYAHLAPGSYRFSVRAAIAGVVSTPATIELSVSAPMWRRAWFLAGVAVLLGLLGWRLYRWRIGHLLAVERVRSRIASDLHDDLGASLARISILSEVAARRTDGVGELVATIGRDARDLMESASDVVWATDPRHDDLAHVLARIRTFAGELLDGPGIAWTLSAPRGAERIALGPDQRRHLYLILKEAVANIARHAGATRVTITVELVGRGLVATVEDDGCGIAADATMGHGLENMRARARESGGSLTIVAPPGGGTRITLALRTR